MNRYCNFDLIYINMNFVMWQKRGSGQSACLAVGAMSGVA